MFKNMNRQAIIIGLVIGLFMNEILTLFFGMSKEEASKISVPIYGILAIVLVLYVAFHYFKRNNQEPKD